MAFNGVEPRNLMRVRGSDLVKDTTYILPGPITLRECTLWPQGLESPHGRSLEEYREARQYTINEIVNKPFKFLGFMGSGKDNWGSHRDMMETWDALGFTLPDTKPGIIIQLLDYKNEQYNGRFYKEKIQDSTWDIYGNHRTTRLYFECLPDGENTLFITPSPLLNTLKKKALNQTVRNTYERMTNQNSTPGTGPANKIRSFLGVQPPKGSERKRKTRKTRNRKSRK